ncbi:MAG TPA: EAL domain-containing protein [Dissulfurispiraceae bacterium]|nr:EAL domain-containing protein [Dissulfurispiraceae bacterium]
MEPKKDYYANIVSSLPEALVITDSNNVIVDINQPAFTELFGYERKEVIGKGIAMLFAHDQEFRLAVDVVSLIGDPHGRAIEAFMRGQNGRGFLADIRTSRLDLPGYAPQTLFLIRDASEKKIAEEQLMQGSLIDGMTGLPNKGLFRDRVHRVFTRSRGRDGRAFAVVFVDLDNFKEINDLYGHDTGDQVIIGAARRIESSLRPSDSVARLGGDEFGILIDDIRDVSYAASSAERILNALRQPLRINAIDVQVTASAGIAISESAYKNPDDLIRDADMAMYRAKAQGRNRVEIFDAAMRDRATRRLQLESDLSIALNRRQFELYYQPIVALTDMKIIAVEALVRWRHPERGIVPAREFITIAEETGYLAAIGEWVLRTLIAHQKAWPSRISVVLNISQSQFGNVDFLESFTHILREEQADSNLLRIDVTEKTLMKDIDYTISVLNALTALGIDIVIDDFGTGSSSLGYLKRFPVSTLKIDRSFISEIPEDSDYAKVVKAATMMAHALGLRVSAEGVENEAQVEFLKIFECDEAQGYHFGRPMAAQAFQELFLSSPHAFRI